MNDLVYEKSVISYENYLKHTEKNDERYNWVKSIIVYIFPYPNETVDGKYSPAKFAYGKDYHQVIKSFLDEEAKCEKLERYEALVDISFLNEKLCACLSGLGVIGKNTLFISNKFGSSVLIGEIVTDKVIDNAIKTSELKMCIGCDICVKSCPNDALEFGFDKNKCLSFLSQKVSYDFSLYDNMKTYFGCDICQDVCPMNKKKNDFNDVFSYDEKANLDLKKMEEIDDYKEFAKDKTYSWIGHLKMLRNIIVVKCNNNDITIDEINKYQKKYGNIKWFFDHLEYLKGKIKNGKN